MLLASALANRVRVLSLLICNVSFIYVHRLFELETTDIRDLRCYCRSCSVSLAWLTLSLMYNICIAFNCCYLPLTFSPARAAVKNVGVCVRCVLFGVVDTSWVWKRNDKDQLSEHTTQYSICIQVVLYSDLYHLQQCYCHLHICYSLLWSQVHKVPSLPTLNSCSAAHGNDLQMTMTVAS